MKILLDWLKDFACFDLEPGEVVDSLNGLGIESEIVSGPAGVPVLHVEIASNRPDCLSVEGIARELSASLGVKFKNAEFTLNDSGAPASETVKVRSDTPLCPRYCARLIRGVKVGASPGWLTGRIEAAGIRSINNVVDATNYSLLVTGHPLHAFDLKKIKGCEIVVRQARDGERIETLDGTVRTLDPSVMVVADSSSPAAIAGVMGGAETEVRGETADVLLEGAYFDPPAVRRTAKMLQMETEASYRFQRGADIEDIPRSLDYAASIIAEIAGGEVAGGLVDYYPETKAPVVVDLRIPRIKEILGVNVDGGFVEEKLSVSGFGIVKNTDGSVRVSVPSFRRDILREIDLIEEVARFYGYGNIPETIPSGAVPAHGGSSELAFHKHLKDILTGCGMNEVVNNALINGRFTAPFGSSMKLLNPLSEEQDVLRPSLSPGLLINASDNIRFGTTDIRLFEVGSVFKDGIEKTSMAGVVSGAPAEHWKAGSEAYGYFDVKGIVEMIFERLGIGEARFGPYEGSLLDDGEAASLDFEHGNGILGKVSDDICVLFGVEAPVYIFELGVEGLFKGRIVERKFNPLPKYPASFRDAAFVLDEAVKAKDVEETLRREGGELLYGAWLFDLYRGKQIPKGCKSLAYNICYRASDRTLEDAEVSAVHGKVVTAVINEFNATLRKD